MKRHYNLPGSTNCPIKSMTPDCLSRMRNTKDLSSVIFCGGAGFTWCSIIMGSIWKYYQGVNSITFIFAVGILFSISLITIGYKILVVATINPVNALRDE
jgi:hypothetical protein